MTADLKKSERRWIRPLPERLINKIAAGEVIERPSAVLKELVENSLDAGASRIDINIEKSGLKLISVIDDGCGIDPDQIEIAFARHATSKIKDFNDLEALLSYGFRGEALPSIGSVSKTKMISRTAEAEAGREIIIEGGVVQSVKPTASPKGTKIEVSDLFFNTPARRKFLKTETTEARHLTRTATAMALGASATAFSYTINGRRLFVLNKNEANQKERVSSLLFGDYKTPLFGIEYKSDLLEIGGFLSYPDNCRRNRYGLYIFINNRYIYSQSLLHAVTSGYGELLPPGNYPVGAVFLNIDPLHVDVNVHPTKAEVRLSDERMLHDLLYGTIKRTLRGSDEIPRKPIIDSSGMSAGGMTVAEAVNKLKSHPTKSELAQSSAFLDKLYDSGRPAPAAADTPGQGEDEAQVQEREQEDISKPESEPGIKYLGQFSELYLLFNVDGDLLIIDQHTAHERILYEEHLKAIESGQVVSQNLLFPVNIELPADRYALYEEASEILLKAGIMAEPFGTRTVMLSAVPLALAKKSPERIFNEVLGDVEELKQAGQDIRKAVAQSIACRAAVMAGQRLTEEEALALFNNLLKTENRHCCPHGRPTILKITRDELDRKFGRK